MLDIIRMIARVMGDMAVGGVKLASYLFNYTGIYALLRYLKRDQTLIFMYHGVSKDDTGSLENFDGKHVNKRLFEKQIKYLKKHYNIISLDKYVELRKGNMSLPKQSVILTFDDGYKNNYTVLGPLMIKYRFPVTIFLSVEQTQSNEISWQNIVAFCLANTSKKDINLSFGEESEKTEKYDLKNYRSRLSSLILIKEKLKRMEESKRTHSLKVLQRECRVSLVNRQVRIGDELYFMSWQDVKKLKNNLSDLLSIGSHSLSHQMLPQLSDNEIKKEISDSKKMIEEKLGSKIKHFSYPYGGYNKFAVKMSEDAGYSSAVTVDYGYNINNANKNADKTDLFRLKRIAVSNTNVMPLFMLSLFVDLGKYVEFFAGKYMRLKRLLK